MEIGGFKINSGELTGTILTIVGIVITIVAKVFGATEGFWKIYTTGFLVTGLSIFGIGLLIAIFSILKSRTSLLDLKRGIDASNFGIILAVSIILVIVINVLVVPKLPSKPEEDLRKMPPKVQSLIRETEHNFKVFFSLSIIIAGMAVSAVPAVKFFKN